MSKRKAQSQYSLAFDDSLNMLFEQCSDEQQQLSAKMLRCSVSIKPFLMPYDVRVAIDKELRAKFAGKVTTNNRSKNIVSWYITNIITSEHKVHSYIKSFEKSDNCVLSFTVILKPFIPTTYPNAKKTKEQ